MTVAIARPVAAALSTVPVVDHVAAFLGIS